MADTAKVPPGAYTGLTGFAAKLPIAWTPLSTVKVCCTVGAAATTVVPGWFAAIVQVPGLAKVSAPPLVMPHTAGVLELKLTVIPELDVAERLGDVP